MQHHFRLGANVRHFSGRCGLGLLWELQPSACCVLFFLFVSGRIANCYQMLFFVHQEIQPNQNQKYSFCIVLLLNILIAIVDDSYNRTKTRAIEIFGRAQGNTLCYIHNSDLLHVQVKSQLFW